MTKFYYNILACLFIVFSWQTIQAQTCRICCGVNADGYQTYKEIYEYDYVSEKPTFPGGDSKLVKFINSTREYPKKAYDAGIQGRVICSFVVNTDGSISNVQILRGVENSLNEEAIRIIKKMPKWSPGRIDGTTVPVRIIYPIPFRK